MSGKLHVDVTILGGGPGGYMAANRASQLGAKVALVEKGELGGTCINRGCIPTKALLHVCGGILRARLLEDYGVHVDSTGLDFSGFIRHADSVAQAARAQVEAMMEERDVAVLKGTGSIVDEGTVAVSGGENVRVESRSIIVATGSSPSIPPIPGVHSEGVITSDDAFRHRERPERALIVGAGALGLEWGTIYRSVGSEVIIIEMMPEVLPQEDEEVAMYLRGFMEEGGIRIITDARVNRIKRQGGELALEIERGEEIRGDLVLLATGRVPNSQGIGLEGLVEMRGGFVVVDDHMRTGTGDIYAVGDVVGKGMLAHVAIHEGLVAGENAAAGNAAMRREAVPRCVYTSPEVACVGLSEDEAREKRGAGVKVVRCPLRMNGRAMTMGSGRGFIKIVYEEEKGRILGAQMLAPHASEIVNELCLGISAGATIEDIALTMHAHPTLSEVIWDAACRGRR
ncbi:hypothetical protein AC482_00845 [miscellaneous Crenarchaeota group-15 archaeon DG-45]|uniref:Dihydrolipoyl dehydrogenase n=1 Tax=miscellaneous Crenarchaeota group-15 archaeon DG-45 TaxID=1685127 RepID=A0A0M0BTA8_9ARCH|nr:MAG: hypothetical protein AC482_00845 [miscellaneous Crenarchaeota group-15 archaeon DG-45]